MKLSNHNNHVELYVADLNSWIRFYADDMGFEILDVKKYVALLSDGHTLLKLREDDTETSSQSS